MTSLAAMAEMEGREHLFCAALCPPVSPSRPLIFTALLFIQSNEIFPLAGLVKVEGCYFSNNLGFVGPRVLFKGGGIRSHWLSIPFLRIPHASGHR